MERTTIEMLKTTRGSEDGCTVSTFKAGGVYDMESDLARVFVEEMKVAVKHPILETPEKIIFETPENGMKKRTLKDKPQRRRKETSFLTVKVCPMAVDARLVELLILRKTLSLKF